MLLANHGALVASKLADVVELAQLLEDVCRLTVLTAGRARSLPRSQLRALRRELRAYVSSRAPLATGRRTR